jgi:hypothetical protein
MKIIRISNKNKARIIKAGIFQAPPAMVENISEWLKTILKMQYHATNYFFHIEELEECKDELDKGQFDEDLYKEIVDGVEMNKKNELKSFLNIGAKYGYTQNDLSKNDWTKIFPLDLSGWRYNYVVEKELKKDRIRVEKVLEAYSEITVSFSVEKHVREFRGRYMPFSPPTIEVVGYKNMPWDERSLSTLEHEIRHLGQYLLSHVLGKYDMAGRPSSKIKTPEIRQFYDKPGYEEKKKNAIEKMREKGVDINSYELHTFDDIEFYTNLGSAIDRYNRAIKYTKLSKEALHFIKKAFVGLEKIPDDYDGEWENKIHQIDRSGHLRDFFIYSRGLHRFPDHIFVSLRKHKDKYRKAVNEFFKATANN